MTVEEFLAVAAAHPRCAWLDGGGAREWSGRRSILAWCEPDDVSLTYSRERGEVTRHTDSRAEVVGDDPFEVVGREIGAGEHWFGYFWLTRCAPDLPARADGAGMPDAVWMRPSHVRFFAHEDMERTSSTGSTRLPRTHEALVAPPDFAAAFAAVQEHLHAGDSYEVNLTYRLAHESDADPAQTYLRLRALNPAPYAGFLQHDVPDARAWLLSSSPERFALVDETGG